MGNELDEHMQFAYAPPLSETKCEKIENDQELIQLVPIFRPQMWQLKTGYDGKGLLRSHLCAPTSFKGYGME